MKKRPQIQACSELLPDGFNSLADAIARLGYDRETADHYAELIGDTPVTDEQGRIVVRDGDTELARLKLK